MQFDGSFKKPRDIHDVLEYSNQEQGSYGLFLDLQLRAYGYAMLGRIGPDEFHRTAAGAIEIPRCDFGDVEGRPGYDLPLDSGKQGESSVCDVRLGDWAPTLSHLSIRMGKTPLSAGESFLISSYP
jgi:hypothetical protein